MRKLTQAFIVLTLLGLVLLPATVLLKRPLRVPSRTALVPSFRV